MSLSKAVSPLALIAAGIVTAGVSFSGLAGAATDAVDKEGAAKELRICASNAEAPFSEKDSTGFEDRIATVLADAMGRKPVFVRTDRPGIYLVRDQLDKKNCDVVMGVDAGDERVLTSRPYYRTGYVLVTKQDRGITASRWDDEQVKDQSRFAVRFYSPAETLLKRIGRFEDNAAYMYSLVDFKSRRNQWIQVPGDRLVGEVARGDADVAVAFAPEVARYVKESRTPLRMTLISNDIDQPDGTPIPMQYDQAIGVRREDAALRAELDRALETSRTEIEKILTEEGIPLLKPNS
ncbi:methanol oxidation system protein MoxJ [Ancylobacter pratisalsi]|uniref:Methanol oxidation system protein MoxJ n=2 Tax=Ancylobacter pratisalsi TaxID=1745854 RepID=A0A6P1YU21_9HYPH|nr:methanol oxidation system protein MoxJ [Ancylobacter pratisalsi]QIB36390.1 methanol oxidation system protein MoxJ [Ancylobacter pratisalsi]